MNQCIRAQVSNHWPYDMAMPGVERIKDLALHSARIAVGCYDDYSGLRLESGQYVLPLSQL